MQIWLSTAARQGGYENWRYKIRVHDQFNLTGKHAIITGGAGMLGVKHAEAIAVTPEFMLILPWEIMPKHRNQVVA